MTHSPDVGLRRLPALDWDSRDLGASVAAVYEWVQNEVDQVSAWYLNEKRGKARWSRRLRIVAVTLATAGAALPFVATGTSAVRIEWGYALLAVAGGVTALDRFFGFSSAWMRYMATELALHQIAHDLQFRRAAMLVRWGGRSPSAEDALSELEHLAGIASAITQEIRRETQLWLDEFGRGLEDLRALAAPSSPPEPTVDGHQV